MKSCMSHLEETRVGDSDSCKHFPSVQNNANIHIHLPSNIGAFYEHWPFVAVVHVITNEKKHVALLIIPPVARYE